MTSTSLPARWHWRWLLAAPHRLGFAAGVLMLAASGIWWMAMNFIAPGLGWVVAWQLPPGLAHGWWMGFGFMPMFFAGFLFTAGPRWLRLAAVPARDLLLPVSLQLPGWCLFVIGAHAEARVAAAGLGLAAAGFSAVAWRLRRMLRASAEPDRVHLQLIFAGCGIACLAMWLGAASLALCEFGWAQAALIAGLWGGIAVVHLSALHRMVPFFGASALPALDAWRPLWLLALFTAAAWMQAALAIPEALGWMEPAALGAAHAAAELAVALVLLALAVRWGLVQSLSIRLLAMLHLGFVWLGLAFLLDALSKALRLSGATGLGLAPLHALGAGFFGSTLMAMVTRVSAGHGGRTVAADDLAWVLFWLLQAAVLARVLAALWPGAPVWLLPLAATLWTTATVAWAWRHGRWYGRPRPDDRPG